MESISITPGVESVLYTPLRSAIFSVTGTPRDSSYQRYREMGRDLMPLEDRTRLNQPIKWMPSHRRIVALEAAGYRSKEIVKLTGLTPNYISIILNDPRADLERRQFGEKVVAAVGDVQLKISLHADEALEEVLDELRTCEDVKVRQKAAFSILDRAGYGAIRKEVVAEMKLPPTVLSGMQDIMGEMKDIQEVDYVIEDEEENVA